MKKIIYITLIVLLAAIIACSVYSYNVILPQKISLFLTDTLSEITGKKVTVGSVEFDIFKGIVIKDLLVHDGKKAIVHLKETFTRPLIIPLLKKKIIFSALRIESPEIFVERRADGSINILELFPANYALKGDLDVFINKIIINNGKLKFCDNALSPVFTRDINNFDLELFLKAPSRIDFYLRSEISCKKPLMLDATGEYNAANNSFRAKLKLTDLFPDDFAAYYAASGFSIPEGKIDALMTVKYANNISDVDAELTTKDLVVSKYNISAMTNAGLKMSYRFNYTDKSFNYKGDVKIHDMSVTGIGSLGEIDITKSDVSFTDSGFRSDNINAEIFDIPVEAAIKLEDYTDPVLNINVDSELDLEEFQEILREDFKVMIPVDIEGSGELHLEMNYRPVEQTITEIRGSLDVGGGRIIFDKNLPPLEDVNGNIDFTPDQLAWSDTSLRYRGIEYLTSGELTNFVEPGVQIRLSSKDLELESIFSLKDKTVYLAGLSGKYCSMRFSLRGEADVTDLSNIDAGLNGTVNIDLSAAGSMPDKLKDKIEKMKLTGNIRAEVTLKGIVNDIRKCVIDGNIFSNDISLFGLKPVNLIIEYSQKKGVGEIKRLHSFLYGGTLQVTGKIDLVSKGMPYQFNIDIDDMRIESLKKDTAFKDHDIAGSLKLDSDLSGVSDDISSMAGSGKIVLKDGKLWQLDLFRGWGVLLFTSDFNNVIFNEGRCHFTIKNKEIASDDLSFKSDFLNLCGTMKINFDKSITSTLKGEFTQAAIDYGLVNKMGTSVGRYSIIAIKGTLNEPKYFVKLDVTNVIDDIASCFSPEKE